MERPDQSARIADESGRRSVAWSVIGSRSLIKQIQSGPTNDSAVDVGASGLPCRFVQDGPEQGTAGFESPGLFGIAPSLSSKEKCRSTFAVSE